MSALELLWAACPGKVAALFAASAALGAMLFMLLEAMLGMPETDEFEEDKP